ncbi:MAG: hypothetical protein WB523_04775 [Candidatus Sulfotelmatobacter sp.]
MPEWRKLVCGVMIVIVPSSLIAQSSGGALLHSSGGTWLNENPAPATAAIFADSLVQTQKGYSARIDAEGSSVQIGSETVVQFQGNELTLDHGSLKLDTATAMTVIVGCITINPIVADRTQYDVTDIDGKVKVIAYKKDVKIRLHGSALRKTKPGASSEFIVKEGEQATRAEHCGVPINNPGPGTRPYLDSIAAKSIGLVVVGVITCYALCRNDDPVSPSKP